MHKSSDFRWQYRVLELVTRQAPLPTILEALAVGMEEHFPDAHVAVLRAEPPHLRVAAAPSMSARHVTALEEMGLEPPLSPCALAVRNRENVIVPDLLADPRWTALQRFSSRHGIHSWWSIPILSAVGVCLGTFSLQRRAKGSPSINDLETIELASGFARLAIEGSERSAALRDAEARIRDSNERLAAVFASSIDGIVTKNLDGDITSWNPACVSLFGYTAKEAIGQRSTILVVPGREAEEENMLEHIRAGRPVRIPLAERVRKDGSRLWVSVSASPLRDAAGNVVGCAAITRDITEVRAAEARRADAADAALRLAAVVDSSIDGILTKDLTGRITSWNAACQRMFGYTAEEAIGQPITMLYPKGKEMEEEAVLRRIRAGQPVRIREAERVRKDGSTFWVSVSASPVRDASGTIIGAAAIKRDVTEERSRERERLEAKERAQELARLQDINRFKTQFINTAAHELRTPLLPLRMQLDLMLTDEQEPPTPAQRKAMEVMRRNLTRLGALVEDLLTIARSQAGRIELALEAVELDKTLRSAQESFDAMAKSQAIDLVVASTATGLVMADSKRVSQVLANLLGNAFKFTPPGGVVTLSARTEGDFVRVSVADSGRGIARANQPRLFQPFVQVHDVDMTQPGSGLGLYICKQIVELHGGTIGVQSQGIGKGSTFWFTLPRPTGHRALAHEVDGDWTPADPGPGAPSA